MELDRVWIEMRLDEIRELSYAKGGNTRGDIQEHTNRSTTTMFIFVAGLRSACATALADTSPTR